MAEKGSARLEQAARVRKMSDGLKARFPDMTRLKALWARLPGKTTWMPDSRQRLADSIALTLIDMGDDAPEDLERYIAEAPVVRGGGADGQAPAATERPEQKAKAKAKAKSKSKSKAETEAEAEGGGAARKAVGGSSPRDGTMSAMVVVMTKDGKKRRDIAKVIAAKFPGTRFAEAGEADAMRLVAWYQRNAKKKGWL